jgi:hypothetical protein
MDYQETSLESSLGCGLLGCAGDLIGGFLLGIIGLVLLSLVVALITPVPSPAYATNTPDFRLTATEDFLNGFVQTSADEPMRVDILPNAQFNIVVDTSVSVLGTSIPVQLTGLFVIQTQGQNLEILLLDTQVSDVTMPPEVTNFFANSLDDFNTELNTTIDNMSSTLEMPLTFTNLDSNGGTFWLEAKITP